VLSVKAVVNVPLFLSFPEQFLLFFCQLSQIGLFLVAQSLKAGGIACIEATA
jgi:hypothetical protein